MLSREALLSINWSDENVTSEVTLTQFRGHVVTVTVSLSKSEAHMYVYISIHVYIDAFVYVHAVRTFLQANSGAADY